MAACLLLMTSVTVTTDDVFTVGTTTLRLSGGDTQTLTGSGTLSISAEGGITHTVTDDDDEIENSLKLTTNIALNGGETWGRGRSGTGDDRD